jgi:hypothetical protein
MMQERKGPFRKVTSAKEYPVYQHCRRRRTTWFLECGHKLFRKASVPVPGRAHCPECLEKVPGPGAQRKCRVCGCTDGDCSGCILRTGKPCHWIEPDLCSACEGKG